VVAGLLVGGLAAVGTVRSASSLLFGLHPGDPTTLVTAALKVVAVLASYVPARRASRLQPSAALRED
jgi:putative ABC transport system permease protein